MADPTRRAVIALAGALVPAGALLPRPALAQAAPGRIATPDLLPLLDGLARIDDGDPSRPRVRIVFSPGCAHSLRMFEATRARRMEAAWRWIPLGGNERGRAACAGALAANDPAALEAVLRGEAPAGGDVGAMAAQDEVILRRAGRLLWDATGTALGTPTQVYRRGDGLCMALRGSLPGAVLDAMLAAAA